MCVIRSFSAPVQCSTNGRLVACEPHLEEWIEVPAPAPEVVTQRLLVQDPA